MAAAHSGWLTIASVSGAARHRGLTGLSTRVDASTREQREAERMGYLDETHGSLSGPEPPIADSSRRSEVPVVRARRTPLRHSAQRSWCTSAANTATKSGCSTSQGVIREYKARIGSLGISSSPSTASRRDTTDYVVYRCEPSDDTIQESLEGKATLANF